MNKNLQYLSKNFEINHSIKINERYKLSIDTQKFILQMCWAQHDSQWFLKSKKEFGIEDGNRLNQQVLKSMGKIEARHILNALGIERGSVHSMTEIFKIMNTIMDTLFPKIMKFDFIVNSEMEGLGIVKKCFIWNMVKKSKGEAEYTCACNFRHNGWLEALGVQGEIIPLKRISLGDEICEFKFRLTK
ncbi:MAG: hypothetical protein EAX96_20295 [Candidatus Lokiarchaeota archaeon]|nr:hypothetical protein [Candidatus Lokiarchaeota archaeon]